MECKLYTIGKSGKLEEVDKTKNNDLVNGQVVMWGGNAGWSPERFVLVEKVTNEFGTKYKAISLKDGRYRFIESNSIKSRDDPDIWHEQHFFIEDEIKSEEDLIVIIMDADVKKIEKENKEKEAEKITAEKIAKGKELFKRYAPKGTKALIVAKYEKDESDVMTDYFATRTTKTVVLGFSKHTRNLFSEMRKHAGKFKETKDLAIKPDFDSNGEKKTDENKDWWEASDEHRETYSMGHGTYLKSSRSRGGWEVRKECMYHSDGNSWLNDSLYIALAEDSKTFQKEVSSCSYCGVIETTDKLYSYVDGNNKSITKNSADLCKACYTAKYGCM